MPNGRVHSITSIAAAAALTAAAPILAHTLGISALDALGAPLGCLAGILVGPDLDLGENGNISHALVRRGFGCRRSFLCFPLYIWFLFWWPYGKLIPHRSILSHAIVISTVIRVIYIIVFTAGLFGTIGFFASFHAFWWGLFGLLVSDTIHTILDILF